MMIDHKDLAEALDRIARSADGQLLYRFLQKTLCAVCLDPNDGALRQHEGRRKFASEMMGLMAEGIADSDRAITFTVSGARASPRTRGAGRRVSADIPVPGWDSPDADTSANGGDAA